MQKFTSGHEAAMYASAEAERINGEYSDDLAQEASVAVRPAAGGGFQVSSFEIGKIVREWQAFMA